MSEQAAFDQFLAGYATEHPIQAALTSPTLATATEVCATCVDTKGTATLSAHIPCLINSAQILIPGLLTLSGLPHEWMIGAGAVAGVVGYGTWWGLSGRNKPVDEQIETAAISILGYSALPLSHYMPVETGQFVRGAAAWVAGGAAVLTVFAGEAILLTARRQIQKVQHYLNSIPFDDQLALASQSIDAVKDMGKLVHQTKLNSSLPWFRPLVRNSGIAVTFAVTLLVAGFTARLTVDEHYASADKLFSSMPIGLQQAIEGWAKDKGKDPLSFILEDPVYGQAAAICGQPNPPIQSKPELRVQSFNPK